MGSDFLDKFRFCPSCGSDRFSINDFKSKRCPSCGFTYYHNAAAAVAVFLEDEDGRILACRRAMDPAKGTLDLIGGFVDPGESLIDAVIREVREECGLDISACRLELVTSYPNVYTFGGFDVNTCDAIFHTMVPNGLIPVPADDVSECIWIPKGELQARIPEFGLDSIRKAVETFSITKC